MSIRLDFFLDNIIEDWTCLKNWTASVRNFKKARARIKVDLMKGKHRQDVVENEKKDNSSKKENEEVATAENSSQDNEEEATTEYSFESIQDEIITDTLRNDKRSDVTKEIVKIYKSQCRNGDLIDLRLKSPFLKQLSEQVATSYLKKMDDLTESLVPKNVHTFLVKFFFTKFNNRGAELSNR
ncbi:hypothetical protein F8M41_025245 [Gigaspora margarita]|uniref:Uncharacterized protein n=1 Tax=Gigaspora margarita TaxID=4874 RepID=A0A8H4ABA5_GIGMA|nr:hypothetical protein F8M41_025245 [Gigaspora margarita]